MTVLITIYLFLFIYLPPLFSFNTLHVLAGGAFIGLMTVYSGNALNIFIRSKLHHLFFIISIAFIYTFIVTILTSQEVIILYNYIIIVEAIFCCAFIISIIEKYKINLFKILLIVGTIQGIIALAAFVFPDVQKIIIEISVEKGLGEVIRQFAGRRYFGFSSFITSTMPTTQALFASIAIIFALNKNIKYLLFVPLLLFSAFINARTSIFLFIICLVAIALTTIFSRKLKQIITVLVIIGIISIVLVVLFNTVIKNNAATYNWINKSFQEVSAMLQGEQEGYFNALFGGFIRFPEGWNLIWGEGISLFGKTGGSDIGIINIIWTGGVTLALWLYIGFISFYFNRIIRVNFEKRSILIVIVLAFLVANVKGSTILSNEFTNASLLIASYIIYINKLECEYPYELEGVKGSV